MNEWYPVPGYEYTEATRDGRVRSCDRVISALNRWGRPNQRTYKGREYSQYECGNGYFRVAVAFLGKKRRPTYVHRLVAATFVDGYKDGYHVNHINGDKKDNRADNLEWVPLEGNVTHAWDTGLCVGTAKKLTPRRVRAIRVAIASGVPFGTIATIADVNKATVVAIATGATWQNVHG